MHSLNVFLLFSTSIILFDTVEFAAAKNWAVILVGCDWYKYTYGFEAGAYKQYNDLVKNGISPENIIVISPDTAAFSGSNPIPGLIAYAYDGGEISADSPVNQYENVPIDYKGSALEIEQFFQIFEGNKTGLDQLGSGRVIESGPNDNIFVYIHTMGVWGFFMLNNYDILYTDKFIPFIEELSAAKVFKNMFIHMHSTAAGSMFDNYLEKDLGIIVYTLGGRYNEFSVSHWNPYFNAWTATRQGLEHFTYLDKAISKNGAKETVLDLYVGSGLFSYDNETVHNLYGNFDLVQKPIKEFYGPKMKNSQPLTVAEILDLKNQVRERTKNSKSIIQMLTEEDTPKKEQDRVARSMKKAIDELLKGSPIPRNVIQEPMEHLPLEKFGCYRKAVETIRSKCLTKDSELLYLKYATNFAKLCSLDVPQQKIVSALERAC